MGNQLLTIGGITQEALFNLENALRFSKRVTKEYDSDFAVAGAKIGDTLQVRKPPYYVGRVGQGLQIEDAIETSVPLTLTTQRGVDIAFTSADLTLSVDEFAKRFLSPAVIKTANGVDSDGLLQYLNVANFVGTPGTIPNALLTYLQAGQKLDEEACPMDDNRCILFNPAMNATIVDALKGLFQDAALIAEQYREGAIGRGAGFDWYRTQNIWANTVGPLGGTPLVKGGGQSGSSLITDGWTSGGALRIKQGNCFTIGSGATGVYAVNPISKQSTGALRCFTVTADGTDSSGGITLQISPAIILSGPFQNVDKAPPDNATINVNGAANTVSPQALAFHEGAFAMGMADLDMPTAGVVAAEREHDDELGIAIRMIKAYDINTDRQPCRLDVLYGWTTLRQELAVRIMS